MLKWKEIEDRDSCLNRALETERIFVLLGRDVCAPSVIRIWAGQRVKAGKNEPSDPQILEALECAALMEKELPELRQRIADGEKEKRWAVIRRVPIYPDGGVGHCRDEFVDSFPNEHLAQHWINCQQGKLHGKHEYMVMGPAR